MAIPTQSQYPTAFDDNTTLLGQLRNREVYTLDQGVSVDSLTAIFNESLVNMNLPNYLVFASGEIWWVDVGQVGGVGNTVITLSDFSQRGADGSDVQPHNVGEEVYVFFSSKYHYLLKDAVIKTQKYIAQVGDDTDKPVNPDVAQVYFASDTFKLYVCFTDNVWTALDMGDHSVLTGLTATDAHGTIYHNDARATTWHSGVSGSHIANGDNHDHTSTNEGGAIRRVVAGTLASRPTASYVGQLYFAQDDGSGGVLYVSYDGATWKSVTGVPTGAIAMFNIACPSGWTRYTSLNEAFPKIGDVYAALTGADTHVNTYSQIIQHYHGIPASGTITTGSQSEYHGHSFPTGTSAGSSYGYQVSGNAHVSTGSDGSHAHTTTVNANTTGTGGAAGADTNSSNHVPEYFEVVFCEKD